VKVKQLAFKRNAEEENIMIKRILVPVDGSYRSRFALKMVEELSGRNQIDLTLLSVKPKKTIRQPAIYHGASGRTVNPIAKRDFNDATDDFDWVVNRSKTQVDQVRLLTEEGDPADRIIEVAKKEMIDLIVMASHGYAGLNKFMLGSVTEAVIAQAPCPVLAVKNDTIPTHILVALDKTPLSERILKPAISLAHLLNAKITLTHVRTKDEMPTSNDLNELYRLDRELYEVIMEASDEGADFYLDKVMAMLQSQLNITVDYIVKEGKPAKEILNIAAENGCDLIAMNTHGQRGLRFAWKTSVTEKVFEHTHIPMLITHFQEEDENTES
jgi:nucleotide-binding universal stress UspA family protein